MKIKTPSNSPLPDMTRERALEIVSDLKRELKKFLFGIDHAIDDTLEALITPIKYSGEGRKEDGQAHVLFVDVPGVGKTDLARNLSFAIDASFDMIAGEPTKMPKDIVGYEYFNPQTGQHFTVKGPLFHHIVLADEINRNNPKGTANLLQAAEERQAVITVTDTENQKMVDKVFRLLPVEGDAEDYKPGDPLFFWLLATGNPVEQAGVYPLSEALRRRFTVSLKIGFPDRESEKMISPDNVVDKEIHQVANLYEILAISKLVDRSVSLSDEADEYIMRLIASSRPDDDDTYNEKRHWSEKLRSLVNENVLEGLASRANFHFRSVAKTKAFMKGHESVSIEDVKDVAMKVMRHRIKLKNVAKGRLREEDIVDKILEDTVVPS